jgi:hypothetical protein
MSQGSKITSRKRIRPQIPPQRLSQPNRSSGVVAEFIQVYSDKIGFFRRGIMVATYRQTGERQDIFRVSFLFPNSTTTYRTCIVRGEETAKQVCEEYGHEIDTIKEWSE